MKARTWIRDIFRAFMKLLFVLAVLFSDTSLVSEFSCVVANCPEIFAISELRLELCRLDILLLLFVIVVVVVVDVIVVVCTDTDKKQSQLLGSVACY